MLSYLISYFSSYQIFRSILFRSGMGYLSAYFIVSFIMPWMIHKFKSKRFGSDLKDNPAPIMGGILLIFATLVSVIMWCLIWSGPYVIAICFALVGFGLIGFWDDLVKIKNRGKIEANEIKPSDHTYKADGLSERHRLILEFGVTVILLGVVFFLFSQIDTRMQIPFVPIKNYFPELPVWIYYFLASVLVVGGANSVNMTDGLDSLATVPMITCLVFVGVVAYISGDSEWSSRLKIPFLNEDVKEITVLSATMCGALIAFLKFNSPPASIYLGDIGSLGFGAAITLAFIFIKAEIFLSIVGGLFMISGVSSVVQLVYFKVMSKMYGRDFALKNRFFYRAPYHHHKQALYKKGEVSINSHYQKVINKFNFLKTTYLVDKPITQDGINSKIVWHNLIKAIWLLILALIVFIKVR
ncbi:MAG: phospho-N-acetylmuramoyl-pentapeptide-transferase [SAR324 cluster bacterium]|nr:phospho-N-acetylmuramoyl-pentapeptide-transferase [SAR324 cluster bacterium]